METATKKTRNFCLVTTIISSKLSKGLCVALGRRSSSRHSSALNCFNKPPTPQTLLWVAHQIQNNSKARMTSKSNTQSGNDIAKLRIDDCAMVEQPSVPDHRTLYIKKKIVLYLNNECYRLFSITGSLRYTVRHGVHNTTTSRTRGTTEQVDTNDNNTGTRE